MELDTLIVRRFTKRLISGEEGDSVYDLFKWKALDEPADEAAELEFPECYSQKSRDFIVSRLHETSIRRAAHRMATFWVDALYDEVLITEEQKVIVYDELVFMLLSQMFAPDSPQWLVEGITEGADDGQSRPRFYFNEEMGEVCEVGELSGRVQSSGCSVSGSVSEFMFLDDSAYSFAGVNAGKFFCRETGFFDLDAFLHAVMLAMLVLEAAVHKGAYPARDIAYNTYMFRPVGLGAANLPKILDMAELPHDSEAARNVVSGILSAVTGYAYYVSALMAEKTGPFGGYARNKGAMLRVLRNHARAADAFEGSSDFEGLDYIPVTINREMLRDAGFDGLADALPEIWGKALDSGEVFGFRNANVTCAVSPEAALAMDADDSIVFSGAEEDMKCKRPVRVKPSGIRSARVHEAVIANKIELSVTILFDGDGRLNGVHVSSGKQDTLVSGLLDSLSAAVSEMLEYGISPGEAADMLKGRKFEPSGAVAGHPHIRYADSVSDLIGQIIDIELGGFVREKENDYNCGGERFCAACGYRGGVGHE